MGRIWEGDKTHCSCKALEMRFVRSLSFSKVLLCILKRNDTKWFGITSFISPGAACPDPGTPPHAQQIPVGRPELSYEVSFKVSYRCNDDGYEYQGDVLECVDNGTSVQWNSSRGDCQGKNRSRLIVTDSIKISQKVMRLVSYFCIIYYTVTLTWPAKVEILSVI